MTTATTTTAAAAPAPRHIEAPVVTGHRVSCPRCGSRLFVEPSNYTCITCGYLHAVSPEDLQGFAAAAAPGRHARHTVKETPPD